MSQWQQTTLGDVCEVLDKFRKPITKRDRTKGPYPYYGATGILDYVIDYLFDERLVLIGEDGAKWGAGDRTAFPADGKYWVNNHAHVIRPDRDVIDDNWIIYYLNFADLSTHITGLTVPKLNQAKLKEIPLLLPSLSEQERIVSVLDEAFEAIDTAIVNTEKNLLNTEELFQSILDQQFSDLDSDESEWQQKKLSDLFKVGSSKRVLKSQWKSEGVPFYRGREITRLSVDGFVDNELFISENDYQEYSEKYGVPEAGDIMITAIGTIGNSYIVNAKDRFYFKDASVLWLKKQTSIKSSFINYWLKSSSFFSQLDEGNSATVDTLTIKKLQNLMIFTPSLFEQERIVSVLDEATTSVQALRDGLLSKLAGLEELKQSVLEKAFSGELTDSVLEEAGV